jgi:ElaB/YqjD/DUF883 family membrane-anchored ribosome-binding protein
MMEAAIHSILFKLEESIKHLMEDVLLCVHQKTQSLRKELTKVVNETQVDLEVTRTSVDTRTKSLLETITDTRKHLHEELGLMIEGETQMTNPQ